VPCQQEGGGGREGKRKGKKAIIGRTSVITLKSIVSLSLDRDEGEREERKKKNVTGLASPETPTAKKGGKGGKTDASQKKRHLASELLQCCQPRKGGKGKEISS